MNGDYGEDIKNNIIENKGSVQQITNLSQHLKDKYKKYGKCHGDIIDWLRIDEHIFVKVKV